MSPKYTLVFALHRQPIRGARFKKNIELLIAEERQLGI